MNVIWMIACLLSCCWPDGALAEEIGLQDCIRQAVAHNLTLKRQDIEKQQAALDVEIARGRFWPVVFFTTGVQHDRTQADSGLTEDNSLVANAGVALDTPLGTRLEAAWSQSSTATNDPGLLVDPLQRTRFEIMVTQPVLRGFGITVNLAELTRSELAYQVVLAGFRDKLNQLIRDVELAYWDLYFAQQDVVVKERSLGRARKQYENTRENIRLGLLPNHDIYVVEESLVSFQSKLRQAENARDAARLQLAQLMQWPAERAGDLTVADQPDLADIRIPGKERLLTRARETSPALQEARARIADARTRLLVERNKRLPELDVQAGFGLSGLGDDLGEGYSRMFGLSDRDAYLGLKLNWPLFSSVNDSQEVRTRLDLASQELAMKDIEQRLAYEVDDHHREILHRTADARLADRIRQLASQKLEAQQVKYKSGAAALKDLVQFVRELDEAEIAWLDSLVGVVKQQARLYYVVGDLHHFRGVEIK